MSLNLTHLRHIALRTPDPQSLATFYQDTWGLHIVAEQDGGFYLRGVGAEYYILALLPGPKRAIEHLAFGLENREAVDRAAQELSEKGVKLHHQPGLITTPGGGYGLQLVDSDGRCIELSCEVEKASETDWQAVVRPNKISHVVLNTADFEGITKFYSEILGMRVSDWSERQMVFLRCNSEHHCISFNRHAYASLNHVAYELPDIDKVMRGIGNLKRKGINPLWGPGRHGPGNNVFAYFGDTAGFVCEYTAEVQKIDEATHQPQVWERIPEKMELWGTSGPATPEVRAAMAGEPDQGLLETINK